MQQNMATTRQQLSTAGSDADPEQHIYEAIVHAVLTQQLTSDSRLPESSLSKIYGVNRALVRRVLERLAGDHIVVLRRNQSAVIASPGPEDTRQVFAARRHIEAEVMRQTAGTLDATTRQAVDAIVADENQAHTGHSHGQRIHLSLRFHEYLATACPNHVLGGILQDLILRTSIAVALYKVPGMAACYRESDHRSIADALIAGDGELAASRACEHLDYLEQRLNYATRIRKNDLASILAG